MRSSFLSDVVFLICLPLGFAVPALGQCESAKLLASDAATGDQFGRYVDLEGDLAIMGAPGDDDFGVSSGAAYVFRRDSQTGLWSEVTKLHASRGSANLFFGTGVALNGDVAAIGAFGDSINGLNSGAVYVFRYDANRGAWNEEAILRPSDGAAGDQFGRAVAVWGDNIIVGVRHDDEWGMNSGSAYVFRYDGATHSWRQQQKLLPPVGGYGHEFGNQVAIRDGIILIGAWGTGDPVPTYGAAYVFRSTADSQAWYLHQTIEVPDRQTDRIFGASVGIDDDALIIGAGNVDGVARCTAHIFRFNPTTSMWVHETELFGTYSAAGVFSHNWVGLEGDVAAMGEYWNYSSNPADQFGSVQLFRRDRKNGQWSPMATLHAPGTNSISTEFGRSLEIRGETLLVGAYVDDEAALNAGAVHVIDLEGADCNANFTCDDVDIASGRSLDLNANGIPDECETTPGDVNGDGIVNVIDLLAVVGAWGACPPPCPADLNSDGEVDVNDLLLVIGNWD